MVCPESVYVSQDSRISKINERSVNKKPGGMSRIEDVEVSVLDPTTVEIGRGVCLGVKWSGILGFTFALSPDQVCLFVDCPEANIFCYFRLVLLIEEDEGIMASVTSVEESPSNTWVGGVV